MAFQVPPFQAMLARAITDLADPDRGEVQVYHQVVGVWRHAVDRQLGFIDPQYAMPALPTMFAVNANQVTCVA